MDKINIKYAISIFIDTVTLSPAQKIISDLFNILGDGYLPSTIQEMTHSGIQKRTIMENQDLGIKVLILTNRLIIEQYPSNAKSLSSIDDFLNISIPIAESILKTFNKESNRISIISKILIENIPSLNDISPKVFKFPEGYNKENTFEWTCRLAKNEIKTLSSNEENINFVSAINRVKGKIINNGIEEDFDGIDIDIDINTIAENIHYRFNHESLEALYKDMLELYKEHENSIYNYVLN
ncbi:hypothetical protein FJR48_09000 [Sulfurimonas lithotrophica]|uniref:Uncharacterized protein n=1 Tax=Sulfurimonas lithotrophica TaxID=2590022 RepID=A0A5P8P2M5_9BACT|nr:hypothetical protein [Sulfurimonas lithotrophica]QFR49857.1 hypothetical protein FJR48_09000 [Sulfurimonas lithotrophica]